MFNLRTTWKRLKDLAHRLVADAVMVYIASKDKRTPYYLRVFAFFIAAYALSPIDLIPDIIPVIGFLDDLLIVPLGVLLLVRLLPEDVLLESRKKAKIKMAKPKNYKFGLAVVGTWILFVGILTLIWFAR